MQDLKNIPKTMCVLPFIHYSIKPNNAVKPCCRFQTHLDEHHDEFKVLNVDRFTPQEILNSSPFEGIRQQMMRGERIPGCEKCYMEYSATGGSMMNVMNERYDVEKYLTEKPELRYLEVAFGNYCNLGCRTCNSTLSTSWHSDDVVLQEYYPDRAAIAPLQHVAFNWAVSDFDNVEEIKFTGGEPMLHPNFIKFLDVILEGGNESHITLDIFTNTSWVPKAKVLTRLSKFKCVKIWLSIDGVGPLQDYVRHNSKWEDVNASANAWCEMEKSNPDVYSVILTPTLNMYNVLGLSDVIDWWYELRSKYSLPLSLQHNAGDIVLSIVTHPSCLSITNLPHKQMVIDNLTSYLNKFDSTSKDYILASKVITTITQLLKKDINKEVDLTEFISFTKDLDRLRKQNFKEMNPSLYELIITAEPRYNEIKGRINDGS